MTSKRSYPAKADTEKQRHRKEKVLGAVNAMTKKVIYLINTAFTVTVAAFFRRFSGKITVDKPIKTVLDNALYQHCKAVMESAQSLNIELLFLPSYSPNPNLIERLWKFTKKENPLRDLL